MTASTIDEEAPRPQPRPRARRVSRFLRVLAAVNAVMHVPVLLAVTEGARRFGAGRPWLAGSLWAAAGVALFVGRARAGMPDRKRHGAIVRFVDVPYFIHWCAALWALVPSVVATIVAPLIELARGTPVSLPMGAYFWAYSSGLVVSAYGTLVRRRWFRVREREVRVAGLDTRLDGLRIAHLSDLHIGTLTPESWGAAWARAANARSPDLAVVTGDLVTSGTEYHEDVARVIGSLRAKLGVYVSMGNHDYFGEGEPLVSLVRDRGARVLRNEGVVVERDGAKLWLAAIDDTWTRRDDVARAMRDRPAEVPAVLLAHEPARFDAAADAGADVVLSGHTHGGQVAVPLLYRWLTLARITHRYRVGLYRRGRSTLHVSPGLGTTGPPLRIGVAPEVTVIVLRAA